MENAEARIECLKMAASLVAPNCSLETVLPVAEKIWAWVQGASKDDVLPPSKVKQAVLKSLAKSGLHPLSASQTQPNKMPE